MLQWGHAFSSVERADTAIPMPLVVGLQWGHAFSSVESILEKSDARVVG